MIDLILHLLILAGVIFVVAETFPGVHVEGYGTSLLVAIVYCIINIFLGTILKVIGIPLTILTLGLFPLIVNAFLLWITDKMIDDFEIDDALTTFLVALVITIADTMLDWIF